ncbi:hypothetical protein BZA70DRAFT_312300 [Myxozyma melibiosi]|uniref:Zn(2)-C6 fungal-type domain-containing protein n=1 Tax=Myxozyma melibiosi TaxID=54550 RepID=A0ABR1F1G5_9ASCO
MVGVAGGSRGCDSCKRRKIKCDETFPRCLRCIKSNRECSGPVVGPVFRKQRVGSGGSGTPLDVDQPGSFIPAPDAVAHKRRRKRIIEGLHPVPVAGAGPKSIASAPQSSLSASPPSLPHQLALFPEYDLYNYCVNLYINWFSRVGHPRRFHGDESILSWATSLPMFALSLTPSTTTYAARALLISHIGIILRNSEIELIGANWYVQALQHQKDVIGLISRDSVSSSSVSSSGSSPCTGSTASDSPPYSSTIMEWASSENPVIPKLEHYSPLLPENSTLPALPKLEDGSVSPDRFRAMKGNEMSSEDDTIVAGMLLAVYELFKFSSSTSWINLLNGASELMRYRGPYAYRSGFNFAIFQSMRGMMTLRAITSRQKTFLSEPLWRTVPWQYSQKTIHHRLLDLTCEIPNYEEAFDELFMFAFSKDPSEPGDLPTPSGQRIPRLRERFCNPEIWIHLRTLSAQLDGISRSMDDWLREYVVDAQEYATRTRRGPPGQLKFDSMTGAPVTVENRCPQFQSDEEWSRAHFFHPAIFYTSLHDARLMTMYYSVKIVICYLQELAAPSLFYEFNDYFGGQQTITDSLDSPACQLRAFVAEQRKTRAQATDVICRSMAYFLSRNSNAAIMSLLFPIGVEHTTLVDPYERGWIWNQLQRVHGRLKAMGKSTPQSESETNGGFILKELDAAECMKELNMFRSLPVCQGCGEHIRLPAL